YAAHGDGERHRQPLALSGPPPCDHFAVKMLFWIMQCTPLRTSTTCETRQSPTIDVSEYASSRESPLLVRKSTVSRTALSMATFKSSSKPTMIQCVFVSMRGQLSFRSLRTMG